MSDQTILQMLRDAHEGAYTGKLSNIEVADLVQDAMGEIVALQQEVAAFIHEVREIHEYSANEPSNELADFAGVYQGGYKPGAF